MKLKQLLHTLGMTQVEQELYISVVKYNKTTASNVATQLGRERTSTYKRLIQMVGSGRLIQTHERGTTFFLPVQLEILKERFFSQFNALQTLTTQRGDIEQEYTTLQSAHQFDTSVKLLSGGESIRYAYQTMKQTIDSGILHKITCISTHTLESLAGGDSELLDHYQGFFEHLKIKNVSVSSHLCEGLSLMELIHHSDSLSAIKSMPVANNATTIRIIGHEIFLLLFTENPQTIHIHSPHVSSLLMFLSEQLESK